MRRLFFFRALTPSPFLQEVAVAPSRERAQHLLAQAAAAVAAQQASPQYADAEADLARAYAFAGQFTDAQAALQRAIQAVPPSRDRHLAYQSELAEILARLHQPEESRRLHRWVLQQSELISGSRGRLYALAQAPFADLLLSQGELDEAEAGALEAFQILHTASMRQQLPVLALLASIRAARDGEERPLLPELPSLLPRQWPLVAKFCVQRALRDPARLSALVLAELRERLEDLGATEPIARAASFELRAADAAGLHAQQRDTARWCLSRAPMAGEESSLRQHAARAEEALGESSSARAEFVRALAASEGGASAALALGRFYMRQGEHEEAAAVFREALARAPQEGRLWAEAGLLASHLARHEEAHDWLGRALELLPKSSSLAEEARAHLAGMGGPSCPCLVRRGLSRSLTAALTPHLPLGLLSSLALVPGASLRLSLARWSTPEEDALLRRELAAAMSRLGLQEALPVEHSYE